MNAAIVFRGFLVSVLTNILILTCHSGTQGNLISILVHCRAGDELIVGDKGHIILYEAGGVSALAGVIPRTVPVQSDGTLLLEVSNHFCLRF